MQNWLNRFAIQLLIIKRFFSTAAEMHSKFLIRTVHQIIKQHSASLSLGTQWLRSKLLQFRPAAASNYKMRRAAARSGLAANWIIQSWWYSDRAQGRCTSCANKEEGLLSYCFPHFHRCTAIRLSLENFYRSKINLAHYAKIIVVIHSVNLSSRAEIREHAHSRRVASLVTVMAAQLVAGS